MFELHPQLAADCVPLGRFPLCQLLLLRDANYPWFVLVPQRPDMREIHQLDEADQQQLLRESVLLARAMEQAFKPDKLNVAALGNLVPQLHVHHVARYRADPAWPAPVWGKVPALAYGPGELERTAAHLLAALPAEAEFTPAD
jgi:diadenosine tetraphosphate (Ap4A) HIT family hydrolase